MAVLIRRRCMRLSSATSKTCTSTTTSSPPSAQSSRHQLSIKAWSISAAWMEISTPCSNSEPGAASLSRCVRQGGGFDFYQKSTSKRILSQHSQPLRILRLQRVDQQLKLRHTTQVGEARIFQKKWPTREPGAHTAIQPLESCLTSLSDGKDASDVVVSVVRMSE